MFTGLLLLCFIVTKGAQFQVIIIICFWMIVISPYFEYMDVVITHSNWVKNEKMHFCLISVGFLWRLHYVCYLNPFSWYFNSFCMVVRALQLSLLILVLHWFHSAVLMLNQISEGEGCFSLLLAPQKKKKSDFSVGECTSFFLLAYRSHTVSQEFWPGKCWASVAVAASLCGPKRRRSFRTAVLCRVRQRVEVWVVLPSVS